MGIFRKVGDWLTEKSDRFIRGDGDTAGYYATREYEQAYAARNADPAADGHEGDETGRKQPLDPFGHGDGEYGGRVPYRSRYDREQEAQQAQYSTRQPAVNPAQAQQAPVQPPMQQQPVRQAPAAQPVQQQPYRQAAPNVVQFPGMQRSPDGSVYAHVEYIVLLRSRSECKDVIAYIKTNASVFLNMEFIASDSERQRCVDMLSGAAYALGCALNKISPRGIYLISSPSVRVVLDPAMQKVTAAPEAQGFARRRYEGDGYRAGYQQQSEAHPQPVGGFTAGSPTARFQAQGAQRPPAGFGSMMAGGATGSYAPVNSSTGRFTAVQQ